MCSAIHEEAMEMKGRRLIAEMIMHVYHDVVANIGVDPGDRPFAIDADRWALERTVRIRGHPADVEVVRHNSCLGCHRED